MSVVGVADQYLVYLAVTLMFTVFSFIFDEQSQKIILQLIAGVAWFVFAFVHLSVGDPTSVLTGVLPMVYVFFGLLFIIVGVYNASNALLIRRRR